MDTARASASSSPPAAAVPSIAPDALYRVLGGPHCPLIVDVRKAAAFDPDDAMLPGALRVTPDAIGAWMAPTHAKPVVVYCVHGHEVSQGAAQKLAARGYRARYLEGGIALWREIGLPTMLKSARFGVPSSSRATRWITRERPKIDRIACPWLVRRFIDPRAEFVYVPTSAVFAEAERRGAIAYDIPGAPLEHDGDRCSFDAFIGTFGLKDAALDDLAAIVRGADTGKPGLTQQSHGLLAVSLGLSHNFSDDHAMLEHGLVLYDALYAWCRHARDEQHNWKPQPVAAA
nr:superoxide dismutase SodM-like protein ChrF [uncultured bacterium]